MNTLTWLQEWYESQCDGDWEHSYGVMLDTLDNPGWSLKISLDYTELEEKKFETISIDRSATDWLRCDVGEAKIGNQSNKAVFQAACGPLNLTEVLEIFQSWAEQEE
jgi:hypothetical protein